MRLRYKIVLVFSVLLCAVVAWLYLPHFIFGWHSRPRDVAQTKHVVLTAAQTLENRLRTGLPLPTNTNELASVLGGSIPRDAWGQSLTYQYFAPTNFILSAMSPYPELLMIDYDSRAASDGVQAVPF